MTTPPVINRFGKTAGVVGTLTTAAVVADQVGLTDFAKDKFGKLIGPEKKTDNKTITLPISPAPTIVQRQEPTVSNEELNKKLNDNIVPNPYTQIDQPSYHWTWYIADEVSISKIKDIDALGTQLDKIDKFIIAETGTTGYNIQSVDIEQPFSQNDSTRSVVNHSSIKMVIKEPMGIFLIDRMLQASNIFGNKNYIKQCYLLELKFHGYHPTSGDYIDKFGPYLNINKKQIDQKKWVWKVIIKDITLEFNEGISTYNIEFVPMDMHGMGDGVQKIDEAFDADSKTINDFIKEFQRKLEVKNENAKTKHQYEFILHKLKDTTVLEGIVAKKDPGEWIIHSLSDTEASRSGSSTVQGQRENKFKVEISKGTSFDTAWEKVISNTEEAQKLIARTKDKERPATVQTPTIAWSIYTEAEILDSNTYNNYYDQYNYKFTYHIRPYVHGYNVMSEDDRKALADKQENNRKISKLIENKILKKRYDYYFTGLNTEITKLDLHINNLYEMLFPYMDGVHSQNINSQNSAKYNYTAAERDNDKQGQIEVYTQDLDNQINDLKNQQVKLQENLIDQKIGRTSPDDDRSGGTRIVKLTSTEKASLDENQKIRETTTDPNKKAIAESNIKQILSKNENSNISKTISELEFQRLNSISRQKDNKVIQLKREGVRKTLFNDAINRVYTEDLDKKTGEGLNLTGAGADKIPISFAMTPKTEQNKGVVESKYDVGRGLFGAVVNNIYNTSAAMLVSLDMEIIGDPFYLGYTNAEIKKYFDPNEKATENGGYTNDLPDILKQLNYVLLIFNYPEKFDEPFADPILPNDYSFFSGIYMIQKVEHKFSEGRFSQTLQLRRELGIQIDGVIK